MPNQDIPIENKLLDGTGLSTVIGLIRSGVGSQIDTKVDTKVDKDSIIPTPGIIGTAIVTIDGKTIYAPNTSVPVTSVNGATGDVVLDAEDISYSATQSIKDKIDNIVTTGGEPNVIETVKVNGVALTPTNKEVDVIVPTKVSDLANDSNFISEVTVTSADTGTTIATVDGKSITVDGRMAVLGGQMQIMGATTNFWLESIDGSRELSVPAYSTSITNGFQVTTKDYVDGAIASAVGDITGVEFNTSYTTYESLPVFGESGVIYLIPNNGSTPNIYDEYIYASGSYEKIGTTETDLSEYAKTSDLAAVATSGSYNDLTDKPSIPTADSFTSTYDNRYALAGHTHDYSKVSASQTQTSGTEIGKITIDNATTTLYAPTIDLTPYATKTYAEGLTSGLAKTTDLTSYIEKSDVIPTSALLVNPVKIATIGGQEIYAPSNQGQVALLERDPIFSASAASTITLTDISRWNGITTIVSNVQSDWNATTGASVILHKPTIPTVPTNVSSFNNDANYITASDVASIDGQIQDLNEAVAYSNENLTINDIDGFAKGTTCTARLYRIGKLRILHCNIQATITTANTDLTIATLSANDRPDNTIVNSYLTQNKDAMVATIRTNGNFSLYAVGTAPASNAFVCRHSFVWTV